MFGSIIIVLTVITSEFLEKTPMSFSTFFGVSLFMPVIF